MKLKKKILFFGATSFAADELVNTLKNKYEIINLSRSKKKGLKNINFNLKKINNSIKKINKLKNVEYLIYFSSFVPLREKSSNLNECFSANVYSLIELLIKLEIKPKKIVLASSGSIYGNSEKIVNEKSFLHLENNYSISKYLQENIIRIYCRDKNIKFLSLRIGYVYNKNLNKKRIINVIINKIKNKKNFKVYNQEKLIFNLIHSKDIAYLTDKILVSGQGIFNLVNNENLSLKKMIRIILQNLNKKIKYRNQNIKSFKGNSIISSSKLLQKYKIRAKIKFNEGLKDLI